MPDGFLMAEDYQRMLYDFAASNSSAIAPTGKKGLADQDYDPMRLRPVSEVASCVEKLLGVESEVPLAWRLGEYWAANFGDVLAARALSSGKIGEALDVAYEHQATLTNTRTIVHRSFGNGLAAVHHGEGQHDPVLRFIFQATMAAKLTSIFSYYGGRERQHQVDRRARCFGALVERLGRELDFIEIDYRDGGLTMVLPPDVLDCKIGNRDDRVVRALDRELKRRASEVPYGGSWTERLKYHVRTNQLSEVSLDDICDRFRIPRRTLGRLLRREGTTFTAILNEQRRERALHLVRSTGVPLKRVAAELGFNSDASFNMAFKSWTGETPMRFRKAAPAKAPANDPEVHAFAQRATLPSHPPQPSLAARPAPISHPLLATYRPCGRQLQA